MAEPPEIPFDPRQILITLAGHGVDFVVVGGVAVQAHGHGRATRDLDVIPRPGLLNLSRLGESLAALGARLLRADPAVDVTDPNLLERAPLVPLITVHGRLDLLNVAFEVLVEQLVVVVLGLAGRRRFEVHAHGRSLTSPCFEVNSGVRVKS